MTHATLLAGIPATNLALYHRVRFAVGDPAAWIDWNGSSLFIVRDIEVDRARRQVKVDRVAAPADFAPPKGLDGDRATATAQAVVQALRQHDISRVTTDRTLPFIFAWHIQQAGIELRYDAELGVRERRSKSEQEIEWMAEAQAATEAAIELACGTIARATAGDDGVLQHEGQPLTSQRVKSMIVRSLVDRGYSVTHGSIVAGPPDSGDCHNSGNGPLRTEQPIIVDVYPTSDATHYCGDCTRTVVHGAVPDEVSRMHAAVVDAKSKAIAGCRVGATGHSVHAATVEAIRQHGYRFARGEVSQLDPVMPHGTGHGVGLEVHEPILLDDGGPEIVAGEVLTIEPGLYSLQSGGVRVEDMIVVGTDGVRILNRLHEGLDWR